MSGGLRGTVPLASRVYGTARVGGSVLAPVGENDGETEMFAVYAAQLWSQLGDTRVGGGAYGRALLTEPDLDFGEHSLHEGGRTVVAGVSISLGS